MSNIDIKVIKRPILQLSQRSVARKSKSIARKWVKITILVIHESEYVIKLLNTLYLHINFRC